MEYSIAVRHRAVATGLPDLFDIRDRLDLLCTVFGLHLAERLAALIEQRRKAGNGR